MKSILNKFLIATSALCATAFAAGADNYSKYYENLPAKIERVSEVTFPSTKVNIKDFGGVADGVTINTKAFADAMAHLAKAGGGTLVVPEGIWYTGPIEFEDNVNLHLDRGALVLFSENLADYPVMESDWEGLKTHRAMSPLTARGKKNIGITGEGCFNGNGQEWRPVKRMKMTDGQWKKLTKRGVTSEDGSLWFPNEQVKYVYGHQSEIMPKVHAGDQEALKQAHDFLRPVLLSFIGCKNVLLQGVTFENSPAWNVHPLECENLIIDGVTIRNPWYAQNGDGIDIESCRRVLLVNSSFDVGDDAICLKSGKDKDGRERGIPSSNILIEGCTVYHGHGGFVIGSEMSGGCKDIIARNCLFIGTDVGLRFKSTRGRGGVVENIYIDDIKMTDIPGEALIFDLYYGIKPGTPVAPVTEETPSFRNIYINNVVCRSAGRAALFNGLPEMPMKNVVIENSRFRANNGFMLNNVDGLTMKKVTVDVPGEKITYGEGVKNVSIN